MSNKLERNLSAALSHMVPDDMYDRIIQTIDSTEERNVMTMKKNKKQKRNPIRWISAVAAACLILVVGFYGGAYYQNNLVVDSIVDIDVNPSIELTTNKQDRVISAVPVNEDAEAILEGMSLKNTDLNVAVNAIIGAMVQKGYLFGDENSILVSVQNQDEAKASEIQTLVLSGISTSLEDNQIEASILKQAVTSNMDTTDAEEFAQNHNISLGKAVFVLGLAAKDSSLDPAELAAMSLRDLAALVEERNIDISDIVDYDVNDSVWKNIADAVEDVDEGEKAANQSDSLITPAEAEEIALNHAGVSASQTTKLEADVEDEDGVQIYEVEFTVGNVEYSYKIEGATGKILKYEQENHGGGNQTSSSGNTTGGGSKTSSGGSTTGGSKTSSGGSTTSSTNQTAIITKEEAKNIALNHAGVSSSDANVVKNELDNDNHIQVYEVKFLAGNMEYYYEIEASTGNILKHEQEKNGSGNQTSSGGNTTGGSETSSSGNTASSTNQTSIITKEEAKNIALNHAGVSASDANVVKNELDQEHGVQVYEVKFLAGNMEYYYEIEASTGNILNYEQEREH